MYVDLHIEIGINMYIVCIEIEKYVHNIYMCMCLCIESNEVLQVTVKGNCPRDVSSILESWICLSGFYAFA